MRFSVTTENSAVTDIRAQGLRRNALIKGCYGQNARLNLATWILKSNTFYVQIQNAVRTANKATDKFDVIAGLAALSLTKILFLPRCCEHQPRARALR